MKNASLPLSTLHLCAGLLLSGLTACSLDEAAPQGTPDPSVIDGTLLAGVDLDGERRVEFYEFAPGQIAIRQLGSREGEEPALASDALQAASLEETYRKLVPGATEIPAALRSAEARRQARRLDLAGLVPNTPPERVGAPSRERVEDVPKVLGWEAEWFRTNFCSSTDVDSVFCATDIVSAYSGVRKTNYFETTGANVSYSVSASMWIDVWNCDGGCSWKRIATHTLSPRYWAIWSFEGTTWYQSGLDAPGGWAEFAMRYRDAFPGAFHQSSEYPYDASLNYTENVQGAAHDSANWYLTQEAGLYKIPVWRPLGAWDQHTAATGIPWQLAGYSHMGDLDQYNGRLYVPMEGATPAIAVFDQNLNYITHTFIPGAYDAPWCAINPVDGLLYVSSFSNVAQVRKLQMSWSGNTMTLTQVGVVDLKDAWGNPLVLQRIQGGAFSSKGHLYLVMDVAGHGVKGFDVRSGRQYANIPVNYDPSWGVFEELEGIDIWDLDGGAAPGINGQIHVLMLDNDGPSADDVFFKHYSVSNAGEKWAL